MRIAFVVLSLGFNATMVYASPQAPTAGTSEGRTTTASTETQYIKASQLSVRPSPIGEIRVPSPENAVAPRVVTIKVTLFVDERGSVAKIAFEEPAPAEPFRDAVQKAFAKARFHPGKVGKRAVKSQMRIEVTFDPKVNQPNTGMAVGSRLH